MKSRSYSGAMSRSVSLGWLIRYWSATRPFASGWFISAPASISSFDRALRVCAASNPIICSFLTVHSSTVFFFLRNGKPASMVTRASIISAAPT